MPPQKSSGACLVFGFHLAILLHSLKTPALPSEFVNLYRFRADRTKLSPSVSLTLYARKSDDVSAPLLFGYGLRAYLALFRPPYLRLRTCVWLGVS